MQQSREQDLMERASREATDKIAIDSIAADSAPDVVFNAQAEGSGDKLLAALADRSAAVVKLQLTSEASEAVLHLALLGQQQSALRELSIRGFQLHSGPVSNPETEMERGYKDCMEQKKYNLQHLTGLTSLTLQQCKESPLFQLAGLTGFPKLQQLSLKDIHSDGITSKKDGVGERDWTPALQSLTELTHLSLVGGHAVRNVGCLTGLKSLHLGDCNLYDYHRAWQTIQVQLKQLTSLRIDDAPGLRICSSPLRTNVQLPAMRRLELVNVGGCEPAVLADMPQLQHVRVVGTPFIGLGLHEQLAQLLQQVPQQVVALLGEGPALLLAVLPQMQQLRHLEIPKAFTVPIKAAPAPAPAGEADAGLLLAAPAGQLLPTAAEAAVFTGGIVGANESGTLSHLPVPGEDLLLPTTSSAAAPSVAAAYSCLTASSNLEHLDLSGCWLPLDAIMHIFPPWRQLPHLKVLLLADPPALSTRRLQEVEGADAPLCAEGLRQLVQSCPGLQHLDLEKALQPGVKLAALRGLTQLTWLRVNNINDAGAADLAGLTSLSELIVSPSGLMTGSGLGELSALTNLTSLTVQLASSLSRQGTCLAFSSKATPPDVWYHVAEAAERRDTDVVQGQDENDCGYSDNDDSE